jgi:outer membrane lipoprotein-sorting protein
VKQGNKFVQKALPVTQVMRHTVRDYKVNTNPPDSAFAFAIPSGATEKKSVADLLKTGK